MENPPGDMVICIQQSSRPAFTDNNREQIFCANLARPSAEHGQLYVLLLFLIHLFIFNDFCQSNYLSIYRTDIRQIFKVGRTMGYGCR